MLKKAKRIKELEEQIELAEAHIKKLAEKIASYQFAAHLYHDAFLELHPAYSAEEAEEGAIVVPKGGDIIPKLYRTLRNNKPWLDEYITPRFQKAWELYQAEHLT